MKRVGLEVEGVVKRIGSRQILSGCSVSVQKGEVVGLLGPNGAGKTTLFSIISGLLKADAGSVFMEGHDITHFPAYRRARMGLGYLPQEPSIFRGLTVEQNILSVLEIFEPDYDLRQHRLEDLLVEFSVEKVRHSSALALSGGERRRVEIARALAADPHFILLDEPLAGIDPIAVGEVRSLISHLSKRGIGVLITDHNVRETLDIVERAYIIYGGGVLMAGTPDDVVNNENVRRIYLGESFSR